MDSSPPARVQSHIAPRHRRLRTEDASWLFDNPRAGWVFISLSAGGQEPQAWLGDHEAPPLLWRVNPQTGAHEAMRWLQPGRHTLRLARARGSRLDIRAIPELAYCYYPRARTSRPTAPMTGPT